MRKPDKGLVGLVVSAILTMAFCVGYAYTMAESFLYSDSKRQIAHSIADKNVNGGLEDKEILQMGRELGLVKKDYPISMRQLSKQIEHLPWHLVDQYLESHGIKFTYQDYKKSQESL